MSASSAEVRDREDEMPSAMDYASHERQFRRVMHLVKWFVIHALVMLPALYFLIIGHQPVTGAILMAVAIGALLYGIVSTPAIARDLEKALEHGPETS
jgi:hypothetical protein